MRFFEFGNTDSSIDKFTVVLRNYIGKAASKKMPSKLSWVTLNGVLKSSGFPLGTDYETFRSMYDSSPPLQSMVVNFDTDGVELNVPGVSAPGSSPTDSQDSEAEVAKIAASAAPQQLAQNQSGVQV